MSTDTRDLETAATDSEKGRGQRDIFDRLLVHLAPSSCLVKAPLTLYSACIASILTFVYRIQASHSSDTTWGLVPSLALR